MTFVVYMVLCEDGSFYTGYTKDLPSRMRLHTNGKGARYTRIHRPKKVVYTEEFQSRKEAMKREKRIKRLNHRQKLEMIKLKKQKKKKRDI